MVVLSLVTNYQVFAAEVSSTNLSGSPGDYTYTGTVSFAPSTASEFTLPILNGATFTQKTSTWGDGTYYAPGTPVPANGGNFAEVANYGYVYFSSGVYNSTITYTLKSPDGGHLVSGVNSNSPGGTGWWSDDGAGVGSGTLWVPFTPEPSALALFAIGIIGVGCRRRRGPAVAAKKALTPGLQSQVSDDRRIAGAG